MQNTYTLCLLSTVNTLYLYGDILGLHALTAVACWYSTVGVLHSLASLQTRQGVAYHNTIFQNPWLYPVLLIECFRIYFPGRISWRSEQLFGSWTR